MAYAQAIAPWALSQRLLRKGLKSSPEELREDREGLRGRGGIVVTTAKGALKGGAYDFVRILWKETGTTLLMGASDPQSSTLIMWSGGNSMEFLSEWAVRRIIAGVVHKQDWGWGWMCGMEECQKVFGRDSSAAPAWKCVTPLCGMSVCEDCVPLSRKKTHMICIQCGAIVQRITFTSEDLLGPCSRTVRGVPLQVSATRSKEWSGEFQLRVVLGDGESQEMLWVRPRLGADTFEAERLDGAACHDSLHSVVRYVAPSVYPYRSFTPPRTCEQECESGIDPGPTHTCSDVECMYFECAKCRGDTGQCPRCHEPVVPLC